MYNTKSAKETTAKKETIIWAFLLTVIIWTFFIISLAGYVSAAENIAGNILSIDGNYAIGANITINDTNTTEQVNTYAGIPLGQYSAVFDNATVGHIARVFSWNESHVGINTGEWTAGTLYVNVSLNITWEDYNASLQNNTTDGETEMDTGTMIFYIGIMCISLFMFIGSFGIDRKLFKFFTGVMLIVVASIIWTASGALSAIFLCLGLYSFARGIFE